MPREDQPVVRSSIEAKRIWLRNYESPDAPEVDENFHPKTPSPVQPSESSALPPALPPTSSNPELPQAPKLLPFQRQNRPWRFDDTREVERRVFREALREVDENRINDINTLILELKKVKQQRDILLRANTILTKCMERMTL